MYSFWRPEDSICAAAGWPGSALNRGVAGPGALGFSLLNSGFWELRRNANSKD